MKKRKVLLAIMVILLVSLFGCGKKGKTEKVTYDEKGNKTWYLGGAESILDENPEPEKFFVGLEDTIDVENIYGSVEYTEKMLYGCYTLNNIEDEMEDFRKNSSFQAVEFSKQEYNITAMPSGVYLGSENVCCELTHYRYSEFEVIKEHEIVVLEFPTEDKLLQTICAYEVAGNKIKFTELHKTSETDEEFAYEIGKAYWEYEFSIQGPYLRLSNGKESVELVAYSFSENVEKELWLYAYSTMDTPLIGELDCLSMKQNAQNYGIKRDGSYYDFMACELKDNGCITMYIQDYDGNVFTKQYAYIISSEGSSIFSNFGLVFLDENKQYYYTDTLAMREAKMLSEDYGNVTLSEQEITEIAEKKSDLYDDLYKEFEKEGIEVTIDRSTGEMFMDSSVLFGGDSAEVTEEGKQLIDQFLAAYSSIIYSEKYDGFIAKTKIEGHTAPTAGSTYESGLPLSEQRANNVKDYCLSAQTEGNMSKLVSTLEAVGCSNSKPIYDSDGNVDMSASRRVSFRFIVNIEQS